MTHGPSHSDPKQICIYCGATNVTLTDEHVVPYSLGGSHVLRKASCLPCANITKKFEQKVARGLWGDARNAFDAPSRRKRNRRKKITTFIGKNSSIPQKVSVDEYPAGFVFYKMCQAGLLQGFSPTLDLSKTWKLIVIDDDKRRKKFFDKYKNYPSIQFRHVPDSFGRLLAKIGYCQVLTALDVGDFRPICLPYITGLNKNISFVVGGTFEDQMPESDFGYVLDTVVFGSSQKIMLIALIRLYANTHAPAYHVVVGDVSGTENVTRVLKKLAGPSRTVDLGPLGAPNCEEHWLPQKLPLPFWSGV